MATGSRADGMYRMAGLALLVAGALSAFLSILPAAPVLTISLLGLLSFFTGLVVMVAVKGESIGLGLALAGTGILAYYLFTGKFDLSGFQTFGLILAYATPAVYGLSLAAFVMGLVADR